MYPSNDAEKKYDLSFCGTVYSNRLMWMKKVQRFAKDNNTVIQRNNNIKINPL
jgi:hypothetical protein